MATGEIKEVDASVVDKVLHKTAASKDAAASDAPAANATASHAALKEAPANATSAVVVKDGAHPDVASQHEHGQGDGKELKKIKTKHPVAAKATLDARSEKLVK